MTLAIAMATIPALAYSQPAFEVASIKASNPVPGPNDRSAFSSHGRFTASGMTVEGLIRSQYGIEGYQISGGPRWINYDRYDIVAKSEGDSSNDQVRLMVNALLADRFKLTFHREIQQLPVYALVVDKGGPKMKPSAADVSYSWRIPHKGQWSVSRVSMGRLASSLSREAGRTVVDLTGLAGNYDFKLEWDPEQASPPGADGANSADSVGPSIFAALQQQLGLRLESRKHPVEMLVIDRVEKPTEN